MAVGTVGCDQYTEIHFVTEAVRRTCRIVYRVVAAKRTASNMGPRYYLVNQKRQMVRPAALLSINFATEDDAFAFLDRGSMPETWPMAYQLW